MKNRFIQLWHNWGVKISLSFADQFIFSGANLILNILLVRWLSPSEYGIFAIAFSLFLFISGFYHALILEPMSVIGSLRYSDKIRTYLGAVAFIHLGFSLLVPGILILVSSIIFLKNVLFAYSLFGLSLTIPLILFFWLFRQVCYFQTRPALALRGSLLYAVFLLSMLAIAHRNNYLSPYSALLIMGLASVGASVMLWPNLSFGIIELSWRKIRFQIKDVLIEHWNYGRWVVGSAMVDWFTFLVYFPLVGLFVGVQQAGAFKAMANIIQPIERVFAAFVLLFVPWLSRQRIKRGEIYLKRKLSQLVLISMILAAIYIIPVIALGPIITKFLYSNNYYLGFVWLLPWLGIVTFIKSISYVLSIGLRVLERPDTNFLSQFIGAIFTLTIGLYLILKVKLLGAVIGSVANVVLITLILLYLLGRHLRLRQTALIKK